MFRVCIDTGGTFTDCVILDHDGNLREVKSPSTPPDFSKGFMNALGEAASAYGMSRDEFIGQTELIIHGTTVATNALVTRNVAKTAMITTKGFRDILEMRRSLKIDTHSMYEAFIPPYEPIVPRDLRFVVEEEMSPEGKVVKPVDPAELEKVIEKIKAEGCEAVAVCFINSYANGETEKAVADIVRKALPGAFVGCSSDILPKMGEYERESTCVISVCLGPVVCRYMDGLEGSLKEAGFGGRLLIIQANQYAQSVDAVKKKPAYMMGSGPAAAPAGAAFLGTMIGRKNFITADMGGTTLDSAMVIAGQVVQTPGMWLGDDRLGLKVVEVSSIGAGGGSIGWINPLGLLQVGPQSAGANPGPVCYGKGGTKPTVTDAAVVLGYVPADNFWSGKMKLAVEDAKDSLKPIAGTLHRSVIEAAEAVMTTVNSNMADGISEITTRRGFDIREFTLLAIGGGGGLCGAALVDHLGIKEVIVPKFSSSFSAWSMFALDVGRDYLRSYISRAKDSDVKKVNALFDTMLHEAWHDFQALNIAREDIVVEKAADIRYAGQYHEIEMVLPEGEITPEDMAGVEHDFHEKHKELFSFALEWVPAEMRNLRLTAKVKGAKKELPRIEKGTADASGARKAGRMCFFGGREMDTAIYEGPRLKAGNFLPGPAIIEEPATTVVIPDGFSCIVDEFGNYIIRKA